jgi:hypothetical protein
MSLKEDLLRIGFHMEQIARFFAENSFDYLSDQKQPSRSAIYNASKRGSARRTFSAIHPVTAFDLANFLDAHAPVLDKLF